MPDKDTTRKIQQVSLVNTDARALNKILVNGFSTLKGQYTTTTWDLFLNARMAQYINITDRHNTPHSQNKEKSQLIISTYIKFDTQLLDGRGGSVSTVPSRRRKCFTLILKHKASHFILVAHFTDGGNPEGCQSKWG